jgi:integrase/recombinase XerC
VRRYVAMLHAKGLAPRSLALTLSAWRGWFRWLARHKGWPANPVLGIRAPKAGAAIAQGALGRSRAETAGGEAIPRRPWRVMPRCSSCCIPSGLRVGELVALDLADNPRRARSR